jgi:hypothetical protein
MQGKFGSLYTIIVDDLKKIPVRRLNCVYVDTYMVLGFFMLLYQLLFLFGISNMRW